MIMSSLVVIVTLSLIYWSLMIVINNHHQANIEAYHRLRSDKFKLNEAILSDDHGLDGVIK